MKKLVFATLTVILCATSAFANEKNGQNSEIGIQVNKKAITAEIEDCSKRGGACLVTLIIDGVPRTRRVCCGNIVIVEIP